MGTGLLRNKENFRVLQAIGSCGIATVRRVAMSLDMNPHEVLYIASRLCKRGLVSSVRGGRGIGGFRLSITLAGERCLPAPTEIVRNPR